MLKTTVANETRKKFILELMDFFTEKGEDVGQIASNSFNFPIVVGEEEAMIEIVVKIPKDIGDDGFLKRQDFEMKMKLKEEKQKEKQRKKEEKIKKDKQKREAEKLERIIK